MLNYSIFFYFRCLYFSQGGECLFAGSHDVLKVYGWEPARTLDTIPTGWGKIQDIAVAQNQLVRQDTIDFLFFNLFKYSSVKMQNYFRSVQVFIPQLLVYMYVI